ncbi:phosphatidylserine decarboxylase [Cryptococcus wingfieldii CBS 7118]|uniref:phosphatidylserine decarboxylase n=1 Tax=Cryptococcus wingfieldii CBS 7118 TaxID=1295528 RepID=A0A1E3K7U4_9TREE|nr:phosphatidylserine decarboxylase [Cryptococcus wingfieldii CBS 7118]ODO08587.1 phosphatidylserine decarboxylase [Cryptococcus wingfieldii CBS 7118]
MPSQEGTIEHALAMADTQPRPQPRFKRLASKPLKLAASTFKQRSSRAPSPGPSATLAPDNASSVSVSSIATVGGWKKRGAGHQRLSRASASGLTPAQVASAARGPSKPLEGEEPAAWLRVRVVEAANLVAKDRSGTSDPFLNLLMPPATRHTTPVIKKTLNPKFPAEGSTFDCPLYLSLAGVIGGRGLEGVLWDKDLIKKDYMGELSIPVDKWFADGIARLWDEQLPLLTQRILSTRRRHKVSGNISFQIGFLPPKGVTTNDEALRRIKIVYGSLVEQGNLSKGSAGVLGVPAYKGIGTVKMRARDAQTEERPHVHGAFNAIQGAASAVAGACSGGHRMSPALNQDRNELDDDEDAEDDDEDLLSDDGMSSSSSNDEYEDAQDEDYGGVGLHRTESPSAELLSDQTAGLTIHPVDPDDKVPKTAGYLDPRRKYETPTRKTSLPAPGYWEVPNMAKSSSADSAASSSGALTPGVPVSGAATPGGTKLKRPLFGRGKSRTSSGNEGKMVVKKKSKGFAFDAEQGKDMLGIVILEIQSAEDLPKLKNALRVSFDMDPFVVISFGKKVFRTRVIRHSLNPVWDEKLLFHVRRHEAAYTAQFAVLDWDKVSGNDMVGTCTLPLSELVEDAPKPDPSTGLYDKEVDGKPAMKEFTLPISTDKDMAWESRHSPKLTIRAKYEPYDALRQRFWRQYIMQYDVDETGALSYTELTAMLDSLGSTLTRNTLEGYFVASGKSPERDELTDEEVIRCLEREVNKSRYEKAKVSRNGASDDVATTGSSTPAAQSGKDGLGFVGPEGNESSPVDPDELAQSILKSKPRNQEGAGDDDTAGNQTNIESTASHRKDSEVPAVKVERTTSFDGKTVPAPGQPGADGSLTPMSASDVDMDENDASPADDRERIINIKTCPLCHRPRLGKKTEQDIVTHLAVCASADWSRVDRIVTANYVTSGQAQRKFLSKIVNKVAIGSYALGANSANTIVQDRITGQLQEEKMAVYVRMGIRVLYKGAKSSMHGARARKLLKSLSIKQGLKYDSPASALDIPGFIAFHNLDVNEILDPLDSFKTFNEFFYRKLKADARPVEEPDNPHRLVSCADSRMMAFETVNEATQIWIKGREFSVAKLLGPNYKDVIDRYDGGALAIFRLAPQDFHRYKSLVDGKIGKMTSIDGEYYTVNPQAIRTTLDVYGENVRMVVPIESPQFGLVMTVWVGAMMVGSILSSVEEGQEVKRGDELGYFAFGGSTIVCLFEKGAVEWDNDLLQNGRASIETLVRVNTGIGHSTRQA